MLGNEWLSNFDIKKIKHMYQCKIEDSSNGSENENDNNSFNGNTYFYFIYYFK